MDYWVAYSNISILQFLSYTVYEITRINIGATAPVLYLFPFVTSPPRPRISQVAAQNNPSVAYERENDVYFLPDLFKQFFLLTEKTGHRNQKSFVNFNIHLLDQCFGVPAYM